MNEDAGGDTGPDEDATGQRFAVNLKAAREHAGLSQRELAARMNELGFRSFYQQTIGKIEAAGRTVSVGEADKLAQACGVSINMLIRPAGRAAEAFRILNAARRVRDARKAAEVAERKYKDQMGLLDWALRHAREEGLADDLADEIAAGERTLSNIRLPQSEETVSAR